ncbi:host attachment family protein [Roseomonas indoligenes]|uniref:Host attachment protein n=1 Tax=Roseomonas indoligenes TaxID=2820811 RepID=A0A940N000_9PROT|nr:host attachment family protein [Pararoseomonas indoligenes]MBP0494004.1 host attachment protein [Pararoseomonas indoligenes]
MAHNIPHNALVLVADGAKAILFRNAGQGGDVNLHEERRLTLSDFSNDGPSGSQGQEASPNDTDEATFGKKLAQTLQTRRAANDYDALVIIADPQTLGEIRKVMHKTVEASVVHTIAKDLTNHAAGDIAAALVK